MKIQPTFMKKFAAVKRTVINDVDDDTKKESFVLKICDNRSDAISWLLAQFEYWDVESIGNIKEEWITCPEWKTLHDFFQNSKKDEGILNWEWERKGNFNSYRIVEFVESEALQFYSRIKNLYGIKDNVIVPM